MDVNVSSSMLRTYKQSVAKKRSADEMQDQPQESSSAPRPSFGKWDVKELPPVHGTKLPPQAAIRPIKSEEQQPQPKPKPSSVYELIRVAFADDHVHMMEKTGSVWKTIDPVISLEDHDVPEHKHESLNNTMTGPPLFKSGKTGVRIPKSSVPSHQHNIVTVEEAAKKLGMTPKEFIDIVDPSDDSESSDEPSSD